MSLLEGFNPFDNDQDIPWELFAKMRTECPVGALDAGPLLLTRYDDVHEALKDGGERLRYFAHEGGMRAPGVHVPDEEQLINEIDGARHTRRRRLLLTALHPRLIAKAETYIRDLGARLLAPLVERGGGDLVEEFTGPLPGMVFAHVLGLPEGDYPQFKAWGDEVLSGTYPTLNRTERGDGLHGAHPELSAYIDGLVADRRRQPREDLITRMAHPDAAGEALSDTEIRVTVMHLIIAGHETTTNLIGNLFEHLLTTPVDRRRLRAEPPLIAVAVEESLRRDPPVLIQPKTCVNPLVVGGSEVPTGARVVLSMAAANRDRAAYESPDDFDLDRRDPRTHNSFGGGAHFCPGAPLARLEARIATEQFLEVLDGAQLVPGYRRRKVHVFWANGPRELPVTLVTSPEPESRGTTDTPSTRARAAAPGSTRPDM